MNDIPDLIYTNISRNLNSKDLVNFYISTKHPDLKIQINQKHKEYIKNKIIDLLEKYRDYYCGFQIIIVLDSNTYKLYNHKQKYYNEDNQEITDFVYLDQNYKTIEFYTSNLYMLYYNIKDFIIINNNNLHYENLIDECSYIYLKNLKNIIDKKF